MKVLVIAYNFPPIASSGTFRTLKFVKYLSQFGWEPVVITVDERCEKMEPKDPELLKQVPESTPVLATHAWKLAGIRKGASKPKAAPAEPACTGKSSKRKRWLRSLARFPDPYSGWFPFAIARGLRAALKYKVDVIYTSAPPHTTNLVGLMLKWMTGKPWVADFRDPWLGNIYKTYSIPQLNTIARWLERRVFANADRVINVSDDRSCEAASRCPASQRQKFVTIPNGFDPDDFTSLGPGNSNTSFQILHMGTFYPSEGGREPSNFLRAMSLLAQSNPEEFEQLHVDFVGEPGWAESHRDFLSSLNLGTHARFPAFRPHREAVRSMMSASLLLLIGSLRKDPGNMPAKLFEYLAVRRPILALVHDGAAAEFVRQSGIGLVANPENPEEIMATLLQMYRQIRAGKFPLEPDPEFVRRYDRRELTRQLAELFGELAPVS